MTRPVRLVEPTDAMLAESAAAGDTRALAQLYRRYARYVAGLAYRLMGRDAEVDDVVQETFLAAAEHLPSLREAGSVRAWLARIAARRVLHRFDARSRWRRVLGDLTATAAPRSDPDPVHELGELGRALAAIPTELRVPWVLHCVEGETLPVVAGVVGVSLATVKRRISEAEARLGELSDVV